MSAYRMDHGQYAWPPIVTRQRLMQEISDVNLHWNRRVTMARWAALVCEAFDTLYREGQDSGRLFVLPLHPWCIGQPFRVRYLQQVLAHVEKHDGAWVTTGAEIAAWYRRLSDRRGT